MNTDYSGLYIEDLNFDGYKDLRLQKGTPAGPNIPYLYWIYDPSQNEELEIILALKVDYENKRIISYTRGSALPTIEQHINILMAILP